MSLAKRVTGLRPRKRLAVGDAAYLVQDRRGGMWDDAVALLIESITTGELPAVIVYRALPRHMAQVKVVDEVQTMVAMADLLAWLNDFAPAAPAATVEPEKFSPAAPASNDAAEIPGKLPRTGAGNKAVKAAWEIECATGRRAIAKDVMARLQCWADTGSEPDVLLKSKKENRAVEWRTTKGESRQFDLATCGKALETWNKSRA